MARLGEEREGKARGQAEAVLAITAALIEAQLQVGGRVGLRGKKGEISHALKDSWWRWNYENPTQPTVGQAQPLLLFGTVKREGECGGFPLPLLGYLLSFLTRGNHPDGKR